MIVSVKPAGSVAAFAALGMHKKINIATSSSGHTCQRRVVAKRAFGTPTAEENFMLISQTEEIKMENAAQADLLGAG
jgi:hypothetical protein